MTASAPRKRRGDGSSQSLRGDRTNEGYRRLRELIVRGRLAPGTRLIESEIAERLGLSRTPARSALHRLQQEGYVVAYQGHRRTRLAVAPLTREDATEVFHIIAELEGLAGRYAANLAPGPRDRLTDELRRLNGELRLAAEAEVHDSNRYFELDRSFHRCYVEAAARPRLLALHDTIKPQVDRYNRVYTSTLFDRILTSADEHDAIIAGLAAGDPDAAQAAIQRNFRNAAERLSTVIDAMGERGSW